jgi:hypothetical protein
MKKSVEISLIFVSLMLLIPTGLAVSAPLYAFNGAYAEYLLSFRLYNTNFQGYVRYSVWNVNVSDRTFMVSITYYGNVSEILGEMFENGSTLSSTFSSNNGFPCLNSTIIALLNKGEALPRVFPNATVSAGVALTVPAGKYVTDEVSFSNGQSEWFDQRTGVLVKEVAFIASTEPIVLQLARTNVKPSSVSYAPYEELAGVIAVALAAVALIVWRAGKPARRGSQ